MGRGGRVGSSVSHGQTSGSGQVLGAGVHPGWGGSCLECKLAHTQPCRYSQMFATGRDAGVGRAGNKGGCRDLRPDF